MHITLDRAVRGTDERDHLNPAAVTDDGILERLLALNQARAGDG